MGVRLKGMHQKPEGFWYSFFHAALSRESGGADASLTAQTCLSFRTAGLRAAVEFLFFNTCTYLVIFRKKANIVLEAEKQHKVISLQTLNAHYLATELTFALKTWSHLIGNLHTSNWKRATWLDGILILGKFTNTWICRGGILLNNNL